MNMTLGSESRMDGAPDLLLPQDMDLIDQLAAQMLEQDQDGVYGGDINMARAHARQIYDQEVANRQAASQAGQAASAAAGDQRRAAQATARGVDPDSLPADEFGNVSPRTVQDYNRPVEDQEALQDQYAGLAGDEIREMRKGSLHGPAGRRRQYDAEQGFGLGRSKTGRSDMDYYDRQQEQQGFMRLQTGEVIPLGKQPTPEQIESLRVHDEWANETPGTERQAIYAPEDYETYREGVREGIRADAQEDMRRFGTGPEENWTEAQRENRAQRTASENRLLDNPAERERKIKRLAQQAGVSRQEARRMLDEGRTAVRPPLPGGEEALTVPLTAAERRRESQELRDMAGTRRDADLDARKSRVTQQAMLAGGQPTGGPMGTRATTTAINELGPGWREIAILNRLTGREYGPTPLGVDAQQLANNLPVMRNMVTGMMNDMDPAAAADRQIQRQIMISQMPPEQQVQLSVQMGQPMGTGHSSAHVGARWNHWINHAGPSGPVAREQGFRMEMEGLGYTPAQIDAWIAQRRAGEPPPPLPPAGGPQPGRPGGAGDMGQGFSG